MIASADLQIASVGQVPSRPAQTPPPPPGESRAAGRERAPTSTGTGPVTRGDTLVAAQEAAAAEKSGKTAKTGEPGREASGDGSAFGQLSPDEQKVVQQLKKQDAEVRRHERAHSAAGGPYAGAPSYEYQRGPDGQLYAVSGEVSIDSSPESDPRETIRKMEMVIRAALAPAEPSAQDRQVAQQAKQNLQEAQRELQQQKRQERESQGPQGAFAGATPDSPPNQGPSPAIQTIAREAYARAAAAGNRSPQPSEAFRAAALQA